MISRDVEENTDDAAEFHNFPGALNSPVMFAASSTKQVDCKTRAESREDPFRLREKCENLLRFFCIEREYWI
jgi:hypothetical protein